MPTYLKKVEYEVDEPETTIEELEEVYLDEGDPDKKVLVGTLLTKKEKEELMTFLQENKDIFAKLMTFNGRAPVKYRPKVSSGQTKGEKIHLGAK